MKNKRKSKTRNSTFVASLSIAVLWLIQFYYLFIHSLINTNWMAYLLITSHKYINNVNSLLFIYRIENRIGWDRMLASHPPIIINYFNLYRRPVRCASKVNSRNFMKMKMNINLYFVAIFDLSIYVVAGILRCPPYIRIYLLHRRHIRNWYKKRHIQNDRNYTYNKKTMTKKTEEDWRSQRQMYRKELSTEMQEADISLH